jgi:two-component sensor histidine kinase
MIPLGLIINELITNILKLAFIKKEKGNIYISLVEANDGMRLTIKDDGVGMPDLDSKNTKSFGYQLIHALTDQISGDLHIETAQGTTVNLHVRDYKLVA